MHFYYSSLSAEIVRYEAKCSVLHNSNYYAFFFCSCR